MSFSRKVSKQGIRIKWRVARWLTRKSKTKLLLLHIISVILCELSQILPCQFPNNQLFWEKLQVLLVLLGSGALPHSKIMLSIVQLQFIYFSLYYYMEISLLRRCWETASYCGCYRLSFNWRPRHLSWARYYICELRQHWSIATPVFCYLCWQEPSDLEPVSNIIFEWS